MDNNATACYNQIICTIVSICGQNYGIHKDVIFLHATMLEKAKYKLKISTKISEILYKHCFQLPIHGTGQGLTSGALYQVFHFKIITRKPMVFYSNHQKVIWLFDITSLGFLMIQLVLTGGNKNDCIEMLKEKMRTDAQLWHNLL